ncbi:hypothetical protein AALO_G00202960 [Alosa alosa]|uniref:Uncharacterized protein n=1 Tax=Alosa alosa TaxID=278164 RepID=A0AAV6G5Y1_9TELE|nr:hypothetical protein AALO_G00202960 [Alosa alosa]
MSQPQSHSQAAGKGPSKKAGIRAAVILIGLLHKSRRQKEREREREREREKEREKEGEESEWKQELLNISNTPLGECPPSPPRTAPPTMKLIDNYPQCLWKLDTAAERRAWPDLALLVGIHISKVIKAKPSHLKAQRGIVCGRPFFL